VANLFADRYRVLSPLGAGILGYVVRVHDETTGEDKAIKLFKPQSMSETSRGRFEREFQAISRIRHPNVVRVHEWGVHAGRPYFVMEYLDGDALDVWANRARPAAGAADYDAFARVVAQTFRQIADALEAVHAAGVVHRDVKPENVIVADGDPPRVKLLDLSHSKDEDDRELTTSGTVVGTASFIAPESAAGGTPAPSADLYALGCVLFQTLVGRPPFHGDNVVDVLMAHVKSPAPDPRDVDPRVPAGLAELCLALMRKSPEDRPASAGEVSAAFARLA
jgi:serine/threonine-protein kinase